ncbi:MAG TPA: NUDIX domain-containing protein [Casimicrobiaceae bacterium]|nr:NUDIX domain-containing protein [Casimicrobiaceae bacterium]
MSDYIRAVRDKVGTMLLEVPTASTIVLDEQKRVLLVRHIEGDVWTTPGGLIEPHETPADAAVRETFEETGLVVAPTRVIGVFGGEVCASTYGNGDRIAWVSTVFAANVIGGTLEHDGEETLEARYVSVDEIARLERRPHVDLFVEAAFSGREAAYFQPPTWRPPQR